jgi:peptide-methionine (R)-S-oxide reductase
VNRDPGRRGSADTAPRAPLTEEQYRVTRLKGTERPFTGKYWNTREPGVYRCVGCGAELFRSAAKYDSGCGWPSFWQPSSPDAVRESLDTSHGMRRTEVVCARCESHLGHVFDDGLQPTGRRYCINSASLDFRRAGTNAAPTAAAPTAGQTAGSEPGAAPPESAR